MGAINSGKLLVSGIIAGLVINLGQTVVHLFLLAEQSAALSQSMGQGEPTGTQIGMYWVLGFAIGMAMMFVYAGFRPRFGAGVNTALVAGATTFVLAELIPMLFFVVSGVVPFGGYLPFMLATLVILLVAAPAGGSLYSE
jgi:hypothetical protein